MPLPAQPCDGKELFQLFQADRLVVHTMPVEIAVKERPRQLSSNKSQLKCGSIFFWRGLQHEDGHHVPNAVARFGDPAHAERTVFATLHDLSAIFETHEQLEQQKPPERHRGPPFVLFSNSDIGNLAKEQPPPDDYREAVWGQAQPKQCQRPAGFNFREYCSTKREKDDPSMEQEGVQWNELRAVLNRDNMVGLLYIHDPKCSPEQHAEEAKQLMAALDHKYTMGVFKLKDKGGVQGDLLTVGGGSSGSNDGGSGSNDGGSSGSNAGGSNDGSTAGGSNGGAAEGGVGSGDAAASPAPAAAAAGDAGGEEGELQNAEGVGVGGGRDVDDTAAADDQQRGRKKRRVGREEATVEGGPRLLTFEEYLQQRAGQKQQAVSAM